MKRTYPELIRAIIEKALMESDSSNSFLEQQACYNWNSIVGPNINRYTTRRYVEKGVMHVFLSSASLKNELSYHRERLVELINQSLKRPVISKIELH